MKAFDEIKSKYNVDIEVDEKGDVLVFCETEQQADQIWDEFECIVPYVIVIKDGVVSKK